jgi:anti-sigma regulatory factor (Ser/Thr protein kinase)
MSKAAVCLLAESITDREILYNIDLIMSEAWANVVRHAYQDREPGLFEITVTMHPGQDVEVDMADWGCGFATWPVDIKNATPEAEGGRGLYIMSQLSDEFTVKRTGKKNILHVKILVREDLWKPIE